METSAVIFGVIILLLAGIVWLARRGGKKSVDNKQLKDTVKELKRDAKVNAEKPLVGDALRNAWDDELPDK